MMNTTLSFRFALRHSEKRRMDGRYNATRTTTSSALHQHAINRALGLMAGTRVSI